MAERCKCGSPAHGKVGMLVFCRTCIAGLAQLPKAMFKAPIMIELHDDDRHIGMAKWIPWACMPKRDRRSK